MKQALNALAFLLSAGAVVLMVLPTYVTTFGADGGSGGFCITAGSTPSCWSILTSSLPWR